MSVLFNYFIKHLLKFKEDRIPGVMISDIKDLSKGYKYIQVIPQQVQIYIETDKSSPDRYFQYYFLSKRYNTNAQKDINKHLSLGYNLLKNTEFIFIHSSLKSHTAYIDEYKNNFSEKFRLVKIDERNYPNDYRVEYFKSDL
jgi:hypothetical protein